MRKAILSILAAIGLGIGSHAAAEIVAEGGNFTMISPVGGLVGGTNDVKFTWDETLNTSVAGAVPNATLASDEPFFGVLWDAHDVTIYGEGTYTIYDDCPAGDAGCLVGTPTTFTVGPGQLGVHMLFDYFPSADIDVVIVWDQETTWAITNPGVVFHDGFDDGTGSGIPDGCPGPTYPDCVIDGLPNTTNTLFQLVSADHIGDGTPGTPMTDGPFPFFRASFNLVQTPGAPEAGNFTVFTAPGTDVPGIDMLANASDGGAPGLGVFLDACDPASTEGGPVTTDTAAGTCDYTAPGVLAVDDSFTYTVIDGDGIPSAPGTVTIDLFNETPTCDPVDLITSRNTPLEIDEVTLLAQCTDPDGAEPLSVDSIDVPPANGTLSAALPAFDYTPDADFVGADSFQYSVSDTRGGVTIGTANIEVSEQPFGNFTMIDSGGVTFGGTNDIVATWDGSVCTSAADPVSACEMIMGSQSSYPFFGSPWSAHDVRVFAPGDYAFDTIQGGILNLSVGAGQLGAHMLFDWGQPSNVTPCGVANCDIDVVLLWDKEGVFNATATAPLYQLEAGPAPALDCEFELVSRDADGDGVPGARMIDGAFVGFRANFNVNLTRGCSEGIVETIISAIEDPSSGGCTLAGISLMPLQRSDLWVLLGFMAWLGVAAANRRHKSRQR